jgi:NADH:ubiquinone oxidoreductase subunit K
MYAVNFLILAALLFAIGVFGVIARRNAVMVLMSIELILNSVNLNLIAFAMMNNSPEGHVFALYVIAVAAAEVGVGLAMVLMIYRNRRSIALDELSVMKGRWSDACSNPFNWLVLGERVAHSARSCNRVSFHHFLRQKDAAERQ